MNNDTIILIAENDAGHATLIRRHLKRAGITNPTEYFRDGEEVLKFLLGNNVRLHKQFLLILDLHMPRIDGMEVLQKIRHSEMLKEMPVIIITTTSNPDEIERCKEQGISGYVLKPDDFGNLAQIVQEA